LVFGGGVFYVGGKKREGGGGGGVTTIRRTKEVLQGGVTYHVASAGQQLHGLPHVVN